VSNTVVARLDPDSGLASAVLTGLQPGDTSVSVVLTFQDGTPPIRALPWSFTNVGSGTVVTVRVIRPELSATPPPARGTPPAS
jgi:hypothetical protein